MAQIIQILSLASIDNHMLAIGAAAILLLFAIGTAIQRLLFSPLREIPGPLYLKIQSLTNKYHEFVGTKRQWLHSLHAQYGAVVVVAPNEVHFASATSLKQIYNTGGRDFLKTEFYDLFKQNGHVNLFTAIDPQQHAAIRRPFADRYSNTNVLRSQILQSVSERATRFVELATMSASSFDIYLYLHAYALDCVTSMLFHPHGTRSLDHGKDREMVNLLSYHDGRYSTVLDYYCPVLSKFWNLLVPPSMSSAKGGHMIEEYVRKNIDNNVSKFTLAARLQERSEVDKDLAIAECLDHLGAGIETTGDTLCFLMWELSKSQNSATMDKLHFELRGVAVGERLENLPYLNAVVQEGLRLFAPGTLPLPRYVPADGRSVDGYFMPGGTIVGCQSYTLHRDPAAFPDPHEFIPERWLSSEKSTERLHLYTPFGVGPRTCIGKHLAQAEIRGLLYAVYSKYKTFPASDMNSSMEMSDQVLTSRPKDMCCKLRFEPYEGAPA